MRGAIEEIDAIAPGLGVAVMRELEKGEMAEQWLAKRRMKAAAKAGRERRTLPNGEVKMMIDPYSYHYWGQRLGYECWKDQQFCREYLRDVEEARVHSRSPRTTVLGADLGKRRFHKSYGEWGVAKRSAA